MRGVVLGAGTLSILLASWVVCASVAENGPSPELNGFYFGQPAPGSEPRVFAPGLISTPHMEHSPLAFSADGKVIVWAVVPVPINEKTDEQSLWFVREGKDGWSSPALLPFSRPGSRSPVFSVDSSRLYYIAADEGSTAAPVPGQQIHEVVRQGEGWSPPGIASTFPLRQPGKMTLAFTLARNGNLYFDLGGPVEGGRWGWSVFLSEFRDGHYQEPRALGGGVNEGRVNQTPFVAPDESYLLFSSWREGSLGGGDLYISYRGKDGAWLPPVSLGEGVNSEAQERFPTVSPDGKYLFFSRSSGRTSDDFYWVDARVLEQARGR